MNDSVFEAVEKNSRILRLDFSSIEFAKLAEEQDFSEEQIQAVGMVFEHLQRKKVDTTIHTLLKMSRLPLKDPKTFENFDFSVIKGRDASRLKTLPSLSAIYAHRNLAFIGPAGTGKTHLAQAFGYECCQRGIKTYFIKMSELRDKFTAARRAGKEASVLNGLVRPSCLIIDEVGHCEFDKENTRLFFDLIDRRYNKEGANFARTVWCFRFGRCTYFGLSGVVLSDERCVPGLGMIQSFLQLLLRERSIIFNAKQHDHSWHHRDASQGHFLRRLPQPLRCWQQHRESHHDPISGEGRPTGGSEADAG